MVQTKYTICDICGESVKARGIGGHKALKHGIVVKTVIRDKSTRVNDTSNDTSTQVNNTSPHTSNTSTQVSNPSTRVQRPSDYLKKRSEVVEKRIEPIMQVSLNDFERIVSVWTKEAEMMRSLSPDKCTIFITGTMKDSVDIYRRKDCPMEKRPWGGLWVCECSLPITHENYRSECKYYSR